MQRADAETEDKLKTEGQETETGMLTETYAVLLHTRRVKPHEKTKPYRKVQNSDVQLRKKGP